MSGHLLAAELPSHSTLTASLQALNPKPQPARRRPDLTDLTNATQLALVLRVKFGAVKRTTDTEAAAVYRRVRLSADVEFGERVELDVELVA